jgi:D-glycero-beta-D-manno-heptose-7-phosphate kinase
MGAFSIQKLKKIKAGCFIFFEMLKAKSKESLYLPKQTENTVLRKKIIETIENFNTKKILIIGDVMVDTYIWGEVNRISPEAPVPIVSCSTEEHRLGGAANVALNVKTLSCQPIICAVTGTDAKAEIFLELLKQNGITTDFIFRDSQRPTTNKTRVIGHTQQLLRIDQESTRFIDEKLEAKLLEKISPLISQKQVDAIIFQDYDKGVITPELIRKVVRLANQFDIPTLVDPKKRNFLNYEGATLFKPNFKEFTEGLNIQLKKNDFEGIFEAAKKFLANMDNQYLFLTLSELGVFITDGRRFENIPARKREIADVSGAGDTVISTIAAGLAAGLPLDVLADLANLAGGLVCEKVGVVPIFKEELIKNI